MLFLKFGSESYGLDFASKSVEKSSSNDTLEPDRDEESSSFDVETNIVIEESGSPLPDEPLTGGPIHNRQYRPCSFANTVSRLRLKKSPFVDIRHSYTKMMNNVLNGHDFNLLELFWRKFFCARPFLRTYINNPKPFNKVPGFSCEGVNFGIAYWSSVALLLPDSVVQYTEPDVYERPMQRGSIIKAKFRLDATKVYFLTPAQLATEYIQASGCAVPTTNALNDEQQDLYCNKKQMIEYSTRKGNGKRYFPPTAPMDWYRAVHGSSPDMLPTYHHNLTQGVAYIHLNTQKQIRGIELQVSVQISPI